MRSTAWIARPVSSAEGRGSGLRRLRAEDLILPGVALLSLAADQISKGLIVSRLQVGQSLDLTSWLAPVFRLTHITNTGAIFGLLPGLGDVFVLVAGVVVVLLFLYYRHIPPGQPLVRVSMGFLLGGALGNLVDRLVRGSVVDFLDLNFWPLEAWPVFNLADASIVSGVALVALTMLLEGGGESQPAEEQG